MKTIIVATDFTQSSNNACKYAAMLASKLNCKLVLFNLYEAPVIHSNTGLYGISSLSERQYSLKKTSTQVKKLEKLFPKLKIDYFVTSGGFKEELERFTKKHFVEAAVMGLKAKDRLNKFLFGSHGVNLVGKINTPVIIVPENFKAHSLNKIVLAVDNSDKLTKKSIIGFERFVSNTKTKPTALYVRTEDEVLQPTQSEIKINSKSLPVKMIEAVDIQDGVKAFCKSNNIDLVAIISKSHSVIHNLFSESITRKIAFTSRVPVMSIHE